MRTARLRLTVAALLALPAAARANSAAICSTSDLSGLPAPWSHGAYAQPEDGVLWSVRSGRLERTPPLPGVDLEAVADERLDDIFFASPRVGWAVGEAGTVVRTTDGGRQWTAQRAGIAAELKQVTCVDESHCWARAQDALIRTTDGGRAWSLVRMKESRTLFDLFFLDDRVGWMVGTGGALLETRDGGVTWERSTVRFRDDDVPSLDVVRFADENIGWVASGRTIARTTNGGDTWEVTLEAPEGTSFFALESRDGRQVFAAVGSLCEEASETIGNYVSEDAGRTWQDVIAPEEREADWEALVQDPGPPSTLERAFVMHTGRESWNVAELGVQPRRVRHLHVVLHAECSDVEVLARETEVADVAAVIGRDPCRLDAERASDVLKRFGWPSDVHPLVVQCSGRQKVFRIPAVVPRRRITRVSPSLRALLETADRLREWPGAEDTAAARAAGQAAVPLLASGAYDAALPDASEFHRVLDGYAGPGPRKGTAGRVEIALPEGVALVREVRPPYPDIAAQARVEGDVVLELVVDPATGAVGDVQVVRGVPLLDAAAVQAARAWNFDPRTTPAQTVRAVVTFAIDRCVPGGLRYGVR